MAAVHIKTGTSTLICTANQWTGFYDKDLIMTELISKSLITIIPLPLGK